LLLVFLALPLCLLANGCGASRVIPQTGADGPGGLPATITPVGTYNITVTGTAAGVTHSMAFTLVVK
jgi:hypothetical protein